MTKLSPFGGVDKRKTGVEREGVIGNNKFCARAQNSGCVPWHGSASARWFEIEEHEGV